MTLPPQVQKVLDDMENFGRLHDANEPNRKRKMLNLQRDTAELLRILLLSSRRKRVLEIGTSNGYSATWIAATLKEIDGAQPLISIERDHEKVLSATANLARSGLSDMVQIREGSASEIVATLEGPFDCVFFDADRTSSQDQLRLLLPKLSRDPLLLTDNVLSHPEEVTEYLAEFVNLPEFLTSTVFVGKGLHIAYRPANPKL